MKALRIIFIAAFVFGVLGTFQISAQKKAEKVTTHYEITDDEGKVHSFDAPGILMINPSGNYLRTIKIKVPDDILAKISFAPFSNKIYSYRILNYNKEGIDVEGCAFLNKGGNLVINVHLNGAGGFFPLGWLKWFE